MPFTGSESDKRLPTKCRLASFVAVLAVAATLAVASPVAAHDSTVCVQAPPIWEHEVVNPGNLSHTGMRGLGNSAITWGNQVHVFYSSGWSNLLMHSWKTNGGPWETEVLDGSANGPQGQVQGHIEPSGISTVAWGNQLHVFYRNRQTGDLRHAVYGSGRWTFETLDGNFNGGGRVNSDTGMYTTTAVHNNELHVFYIDKTTRYLRHAWYNPDDKWRLESLAAQLAIDWSRPASSARTSSTSSIRMAPASSTAGCIPGTCTRKSTSTAGRPPAAKSSTRGRCTCSIPTRRRTSGTPGTTRTGTTRSSTALAAAAAVLSPTSTNRHRSSPATTCACFDWDSSNGDLRQAWWDWAKWNFGALDGASTCSGATTAPVGGFASPTIYNNKVYVFHHAFELPSSVVPPFGMPGHLRVASLPLT